MNKKVTTYFLTIWGIFLLCSCGASPKLTATEQDEPKCGPFPGMINTKCTPAYRTLWGEHRREQTELQDCTSRLQQLEVASYETEANLTHYEAALTTCTADLLHYKNERPRFSGPDRPLSQRDVYVGVSCGLGGMALGTVVGIWVYRSRQKMKSSHQESISEQLLRQRDLEIARFRNGGSSNVTTQTTGQPTENQPELVQRLDKRLKTLENTVTDQRKGLDTTNSQLNVLLKATEVLGNEVNTMNTEIQSVKTDLKSVKPGAQGAGAGK